MTKDETLKLALEALDGGHIDRAYGYIQEALAQPEQEPLEYWNAVEGWVKIDEVREHFDSVGCGTIYKTAGEDRVPLYTSPPQRQMVSTTDMMMGLADRLGELPDDIDPRAWEHLLVYAPQRQPLDRNTILNIHAMRNWPRTQFADKGYGIALDTVTVIDFARAIEAAHGIGDKT